jgi:asparagine synthase (glutamine-hydrolysing)
VSFRFVALASSPDDQDSGHLRRRIHDRLVRKDNAWQVSFESRCLLVLHADARSGATGAISIANGAGVVLGTLFEARADARTVRAIETLTEEKSSRIVASCGRYLIQNYWGRYIAFIQGPACSGYWAVRDPIGALPCYYVSHENVRIFFSLAEDLAALQLVRTSIDWEFVAAHVQRPRALRSQRTSLHSIKELLPGECLDASASTRTYWSPTAVARKEYKEGAHDLAEKVHDTTALCVSAWASCYSRITHLLSGGLDSSIVLYCVREYQPRTRLTALTYFNTFSAAADERNFARFMAEAAGCELVACEEDPARTDLAVLMEASASVRPWDVQYFQTHATSEGQLTHRNESQAVFTGSGGDHVYFQGPVTLAVADYIFHYGLDRHALSLCFDIAYGEGLSFWSVLARGLLDGLCLQRWSTERNIRRVHLATPLVHDIARRSGLLQPPWLCDSKGISHAKLDHIRMASVPHDFYHPFDIHDAPDRVSPLISQPLVELCLRTPVHVLAAGAQDRYLARTAFSSKLPLEIVSRRAKGTADAYIQRLLVHNRRFACEMLLDGMLVANGYLDREGLERTLTTEEGGLGGNVAEVMIFHLNTECWLRKAAAIWAVPTSSLW